MKIEQLVLVGKVMSVPVGVPPPAALSAGDALSSQWLGHPLAAGQVFSFCYTNSICLVAAMTRPGTTGWSVALGFAFPKDGGPARRHAWVKHGNAHYDPTWFRLGWDTALCKYYALTGEYFAEVEGMPRTKEECLAGERLLARKVSDLAESWELESV